MRQLHWSLAFFLICISAFAASSQPQQQRSDLMEDVDYVVIPRQREFRGNRLCASSGPCFHGDNRLTETADYCAAARIGICDLRKVRTRLIVRALSSGGSRHGKTLISAFGASDATSIEVCSGCDGVSSGKTRIGVRQFLMNSRVD